MKQSIIAFFFGAAAATASAFSIDRIGGEAESLYAEWAPVEGATRYEVYYTAPGASEVKADGPLVRFYPSKVRFDLPGIPAGSYTVRVAATDKDGKSVGVASSEPVEVRSYVREGFAFTGESAPGAYTAEGRLKENARIIYVSAENVNTVTLEVIKDKKGNKETKTGLAEILAAMSKGFEKRPLDIRFIGTIEASAFDGLKDGNYINFQGNNASDRILADITLEGIGNDATLKGYGICFKRTCRIEIRNVGIMLFGDDAISMDTDNHHLWIHNNDFFYGSPGSDADQIKGDGSIDIKYRSTDLTIDHNRFIDSGKVMGCGGTTGEDENLRITYHHNWFDHADSRCPRLHYITAHVYNNYYDGVPVYCIGNTSETSAFVEANYFRNCKRPMMISGQGTDSYDTKTGTYTLKGTFSGQPGGMTKAYNNLFAENTPKLVYQTQHPTQFDAYLVTTRTEQVPATVKSVKGGYAYNNFDTAEGMYESTPDAPEDVPSIVTSRAGRVERGDFKWTFDNATADEDHSLNADLKQAILAYTSALQGVQGISDYTPSGITAVTAADADASPLFYDLSGRKIEKGNLTPGVYIKVTGNQATKIVIR